MGKRTCIVFVSLILVSGRLMEAQHSADAAKQLVVEAVAEAGKRLVKKECSDFFGAGALAALTSAKYRVVSFGQPRFREGKLAVAGAATIRETGMVLINLDGPFVNPKLIAGGVVHRFNSILSPPESPVMLTDPDFRALLLLHELGHLLGKFGPDTAATSRSQHYNKAILKHCF